MMLAQKNLFPLLWMLSLLVPSISISPTQPILVNPNTESSPSNFMFYFSLQHDLITSSYLMVTFSPLTTSAIPSTCILMDHRTTKVSKCLNLNTAGSEITITQSAVNNANPNIDSLKTIVLQFSETLTANTEYKIQIVTNNVLPNIGSITTSFEMYAITKTGVMIEENWNFGQVYFEPRQNKVLSILSRNDMIYNLPGTSFTNLFFDVTIGVATPTPYSRIKFVMKGGFKFTDSSLVRTQAIVGVAPTILSSKIVSPNVIITTFNQSFAVGRKFSLLIADYLNPLSITSGYISVYHLPYNSMSPLEVSEQSIPITTIPFTPTLNLLTIDGTVPSKPIHYYTNTIQYIKLTILVNRDLDSKFVIQVENDLVDILEGSVFAKTSTVESNLLLYEHYSARGVRISGFPLIPDSSLITVTMRVSISSLSTFTFTVSVDEKDNLANPIIKGSVTSSAALIPETYISALKGSESELNIISMMKSADSSIFFTVTPNFPTNAGSSLKLITSKDMIKTTNFVASTSCIIAGNPETCTVTSNTTFTTINIASNSSYNLFPQSVATTVVINNLAFLFGSSHSEHIYHFYFQLTVSQAVNALTKNLLMVPLVIPQRNQLTSFDSYFSNDLNNTGVNFPNILRIVSYHTNQWQNIIQAYERRMISVFAFRGWTHLFSLNNGDAYPAKSNIPGFTFTYWQGRSSNSNEEFIIDWERVDIILDGSETTTNFNIILPTSFVNAGYLLFEIMVGVYNINTREIRYLEIEPRTTKVAAAVALSSKPKVTTNKVELAGLAGSSKNKINVTITPGSPTYSATTYSSALIIVSDWQLYDDSSSFSSVSLASVDPIFANIEQKPLWIYMKDEKQYLTYIPLKTIGVFNTQFIIQLDNIKLPYSHDLPYYSIYLIDETGTIDCYNELINQDKGVFYESTLKSLTFTCNVNSLGVINTFCTMQFIPNQMVEINSVIAVYFTGMQVSTNLCLMTQAGTSIPTTCESNTDKNELRLTILNTQRLMKLQAYSVQISGVSIINTTIIQYVVAEIRDPTSSYVIETGTRILITTVASFRPVYIDEVAYSKSNPIVYSSFTVKFQLPRQLNEDESFALVMSRDLSNLNTISSKLNVKLLDASGVQIPVVWELNNKYYQIRFEGLVGVLTASNYTIQIYGIKTPSTVEQDLLSIIYLRDYDMSYTVYNNRDSTALFPTLTDKINSLIVLAPYFNTEGMEQQLDFTIQNQYGPVTEDTVWIINFPQYYSEDLWNEDYLIYCKIETTKIQCEKDPNTPYQLVIRKSPRVIENGDTYTLRVYGLPCPRAQYLNGNADYVVESIFLGISTSSTSEEYLEYSELFVTDRIINPENETNYGSIIVKKIESSNMEVLQSTFFTITAISTNDIFMDQWIYITFPQEFNNFNDISLSVKLMQGSTDKTYVAEVVNRRIGFQTTAMALSPGVDFKMAISSLPTPISPCIVDMNKLKIMAVTSNKLATTAATLQRHNLVSQIQFLPSALHIVINNYLPITVTAGTYSLPVKIQPSDFSTFVSNMKITFVSDALQFDSSPTYIYLGEQYGTFSVGADQNIIPTVYAFDIIKSEASISAFYTSLTKYTVLISNVPIDVTIPSSFDVPLGGCSVPFKVQLSNSPYSDINMNFQYDTILYNLHLFWVNEQTSYNELEFNSKITSRWLSFCSDIYIGLSNLNVSVYLGGTNYQAFQLTNNLININIISNATTNIQPTLSLATKNLQKTYAGFELTTNLKGQIFYELKLAPLDSPLDLITLKSTVKQYHLILEAQSDYMSSIYLSDRDHRIGIAAAIAGVNPLEFQNLLPSKQYVLCVYFENQHRVTSTRICKTFSTMSWGIITKASIKFTSSIYSSQLNKALCFFVRQSESEINQVVDIDGQSCSLSAAPQNYNYAYRGSTISSELTETIIYFVTNRNLTTDPSVTLFSNIYDSNGITAASLTVALSSFAINYISSSYLLGNFNPVSAIQGSFKPEFSSDEPEYNNETETITIGNIKLSKPGSVYMVLTFNKRIIYNDVTGNSDINIRVAITPSKEQLLNCEDGYGDPAVDCRRVVLLQSQKKTITFTDIKKDSVFIVYYAIANEYPLRPILVSSVQNFTIITTWQSTLILQMAAVFLLALLLKA